VSFPVLAALGALALIFFGVLLARLYFVVTRPLSTLNESVRKLDEMKKDFISTASHEMRTPLTSIGGYVRLLTAGDAGPVTRTQKEFLEIIDTNVTRLNHLISDILDVERMDSHEVWLTREPQDLASILRECVSSMSVVAAGKKLDLRYRLDAPAIPVLGDRSRLIQLFMNLLSNAIKYTQEGSVEIEASLDASQVEIRIRDTGIGMTPEEQENLFQRFYRAKSAIATGEGGTGLGLVIVRQIVEAHRGTIRCESHSGKGTTFTVVLPLHEAQRRVDEPTSSVLEGLVGAQGRRAILSESNSDLRHLIQRDLRHEPMASHEER
jgi:signal transduction histidine kinase